SHPAAPEPLSECAPNTERLAAKDRGRRRCRRCGQEFPCSRDSQPEDFLQYGRQLLSLPGQNKPANGKPKRLCGRVPVRQDTLRLAPSKPARPLQNASARFPRPPVPWLLLGFSSQRDRKSTRLNSSHVAISY